MMCAAGSNLNSFAKNFAPPVMFSDLAAYKIHPIMTDPESERKSEKNLKASIYNIFFIRCKDSNFMASEHVCYPICQLCN